MAASSCIRTHMPVNLFGDLFEALKSRCIGYAVYLHVHPEVGKKLVGASEKAVGDSGLQATEIYLVGDGQDPEMGA